MAKELQLKGFELIYCDQALLGILDFLPAEFYRAFAAFELVWLDERPRR